MNDKEIEQEIYTHLDSLPYAGGYPYDWKESLAKHLYATFQSALTNNKQVVSDEEINELGIAYAQKEFGDVNTNKWKYSKTKAAEDFVNGYKSALNTYSADGWINIKDRLPEIGQKVDLWLMPEDEEKSHRISWTWEKESAASIKISGCKVTHWQPLPKPPITDK